jgi:hypothetical protein
VALARLLLKGLAIDDAYFPAGVRDKARLLIMPLTTPEQVLRKMVWPVRLSLLALHLNPDAVNGLC